MCVSFIIPLQANKSKESQLNDASDCGTSDDGSNKKPTKKKRVSFKFGFETSDDAHIAKKEPNTTFDPPVSIIKKECLRAMVAGPIIAPSRLNVLTPLRLQHNNANNIDKLNALTFKSKTPKKDTNSDENVSSNEDDQSDGDRESDGRKKGGSDDNRDSDEESNPSRNGDNDDDNNANDRSKWVAFQLPKRNSHSNRVIKSNKRITDDKDGSGKKKDAKPENDTDPFEMNSKKEGKRIQMPYFWLLNLTSII